TCALRHGCASGTCTSMSPNSPCGICLAPKPAGQICNCAGDCASGLYCPSDAGGCAARLPDGAACTLPTRQCDEDPCQTRCVTRGDGTARCGLLPTGQSCGELFACNGADYCAGFEGTCQR